MKIILLLLYMRMPSSCETEPSGWVMIKSGDDFTFIVPRKAAEASGMLKNMLDPNGKWRSFIELQLRSALQVVSQKHIRIYARYSGKSHLPIVAHKLFHWLPGVLLSLKRWLNTSSIKFNMRKLAQKRRFQISLNVLSQKWFWKRAWLAFPLLVHHY